MTPRVRFHVSRPFHKFYLSEVYSEELLERTLRAVRDFEKFYRPFEPALFQQVRELIGGTFRQEEIEVYTFLPECKRVPISSPLLVRINPQRNYQTFAFLVHELVHHHLSTALEFQQYSGDLQDFNYNGLEEHTIVVWTTDKILTSLFGEEAVQKYRLRSFWPAEYRSWFEKAAAAGNIQEQLAPLSRT